MSSCPRIDPSRDVPRVVPLVLRKLARESLPMLSQAVGYAATALGLVAAAGGKPVLVKEIAEAADIPSAYLAKVINILSHKGLVLTQRGIGGGVCLSRPAQEVSLHDLCVALDDPCVGTRCMLGTAACSDDRACPAHKFWAGHRAKHIEFLKQTTIADIAAFESRKRWKRSGASAEIGGNRP